MVYDLLDAKRQWRTYLDNLKLIHVPNQADLAAAALAAQGKLCLVGNINTSHCVFVRVVCPTGLLDMWSQIMM